MVKTLLRFVLNGVLALALLTMSAMVAGGVMALTDSAPVAATTPITPLPFLQSAPA